MRPPLQGAFRGLVRDPAVLTGRNSRMLSGQRLWPPLTADCPPGLRPLPGRPRHSQSTDCLSVGKEGTRLAPTEAPSLPFPVGDLLHRAPTYWWVRKRVTTHLWGQMFDVAGLRCGISYPISQATSAVQTDSLVITYSPKHQSPDDSNYKACIDSRAL